MLNIKNVFYIGRGAYWPFVSTPAIAFALWFFVSRDILVCNGVIAPVANVKSAQNELADYASALANRPGTPVITVHRERDGDVEDRLVVRTMNGAGRISQPMWQFVLLLLFAVVLALWAGALVLYFACDKPKGRVLAGLNFLVATGSLASIFLVAGLKVLKEFVL